MEALYIFLGAILTFLGTLFVEWLKGRSENKQRSDNFVLYLKQELASIKKGLDELKTVQDYSRYYDSIILDRLRNSINRLESERKATIYLPNIETQQTYIDLVSDISVFVSQVGGVQAFYNNQKEKRNPELFKTEQDLSKYYEDKRTEKAIELVDIKRRIEDFLRQLTY